VLLLPDGRIASAVQVAPGLVVAETWPYVEAVIWTARVAGGGTGGGTTTGGTTGGATGAGATVGAGDGDADASGEGDSSGEGDALAVGRGLAVDVVVFVPPPTRAPMTARRKKRPISPAQPRMIAFVRRRRLGGTDPGVAGGVPG